MQCTLNPKKNKAMKKNLIALAIITVVFAVSFNTAYLNIDLAHPFVQLLAFLSIIIGSIAAWAISNKDVDTAKA